jgi:hypothetical protein
MLVVVLAAVKVVCVCVCVCVFCFTLYACVAIILHKAVSNGWVLTPIFR